MQGAHTKRRLLPSLQALLMHQHAALTTAKQQRSPLVALVALPEAGAAGSGGTALLVGGRRTRISAHTYHDGGEEPQVGAGCVLG